MSSRYRKKRKSDIKIFESGAHRAAKMTANGVHLRVGSYFSCGAGGWDDEDIVPYNLSRFVFRRGRCPHRSVFPYAKKERYPSGYRSFLVREAGFDAEL